MRVEKRLNWRRLSLQYPFAEKSFRNCRWICTLVKPWMNVFFVGVGECWPWSCRNLLSQAWASSSLGFLLGVLRIPDGFLLSNFSHASFVVPNRFKQQSLQSHTFQWDSLATAWGVLLNQIHQTLLLLLLWHLVQLVLNIPKISNCHPSNTALKAIYSGLPVGHLLGSWLWPDMEATSEKKSQASVKFPIVKMLCSRINKHRSKFIT